MQVLDLSHNQISRLDQLGSKLGNISKLSLSHNQITSLEGTVNTSKYTYAYIHIHMRTHNTHIWVVTFDIFSAGFRKLFSLVYLNLSHNSIANVSLITKIYIVIFLYQIKEVEHLSTLDCLEQLFLKGNSLTQMIDYRIRVFTLLSKIYKQVIWLFIELFVFCCFQLSLDGAKATVEEQVTLLSLLLTYTMLLCSTGCSGPWSINWWW